MATSHPHWASAGPVILRHRLESVKILPPVGANDPDLYGAVTALATTLPEIQAPFRRRVFSMAVTASPDGQQGQPTSWSAAVDALAAGRSFDAATGGLVYLDQAEHNAHRLFVVAAGNIDEAKLNPDHLSLCDTEAVHDPAHAWNALTVGASTEKATIVDANYNGWAPVATSGDLSPWSSTGVTLSAKWPNKPDVVFEGGNQLRHRGSLHCDIWRGDAAKLAERGLVGVYPVKGWWQEQPKRDRSAFGARYALIVSIQTDAEDVDIWTPVAQQVGIPIQAIDVEL